VLILIFHGLKNMQGFNLYFLFASLIGREMLFVDQNPIISSLKNEIRNWLFHHLFLVYLFMGH